MGSEMILVFVRSDLPFLDSLRPDPKVKPSLENLTMKSKSEICSLIGVF